MAETTTVTIDGARTALVFGAHYRVRFGRTNRILGDAELASRAPNGDLLFREATSSGKRETVRVRPSTIDAIFGNGTEAIDYRDQAIDGIEPPRRLDGERPVDYSEPERDRFAEPSLVSRKDGETWSDLLRRLERPIPAGLGAAYSRWVETGPGQEALRAAADESKAARKIDAFARRVAKARSGDDRAIDRLGDEADEATRKVVPFRPAPKPSQVVVDGVVVATTRRVSAKAPKRGRRLATEDVRVAVPRGPFPDLTPSEEAHLMREESGSVDAPLPVALVAKTRGAKPYSERNQVWKCGICHARTRKPECVGSASAPHPAVSAPAGKRAADRTAG